MIIGSWVSNQIESRVIARVGHATSLFAGSIITPGVIDLLQNQISSNVSDLAFAKILSAAKLGDHIVAFKVWDRAGRVIYSSNREEIGNVFTIEAGLLEAWEGVVSAEISDLDRDEHKWQRTRATRLLETYSPIREPGTGQILAVVEFYQSVAEIEQEIRRARTLSWIIVGAVVLMIYLSLVAIVVTGSRTIIAQKDELQRAVAEYRILSDRNIVLNDRLRSAAVRATALNESYLRGIAAELHDGPGQDLGYSLLILDRFAPKADMPSDKKKDVTKDLRMALERALEEIRHISAGLRSPDLENFTVEEAVTHAVRIHGTRSGAQITAHCQNVPSTAPLATKITIFRVIQESLINAHRHAGDELPRVIVTGKNGVIIVQITDSGPGMPDESVFKNGIHLGISVMKERVELLGGRLEITSCESSGTTVRAVLPCRNQEGT